MRWLPLLLGIFAAYLLTTVFAALGLGAVDFFLAAAIACALLLPTAEARISAWIVGFAQDLGSADPLGIHALGLGLLGLIVTLLRDAVNWRVWWARWGLGLVGAAPAALLVGLFSHWRHATSTPLLSVLGDALLIALLSSLAATVALALPPLARRQRRRRWYVPRM